MRLIDAEPLENRSPKLRALIKEQPTIDAVPVVRCGDCKIAETVNCPMWKAHFGFTDGDYCSCGVPKEEE